LTVEIVGIIGILLLLALIALRIPIAYSMLLVGFLGFSYLVSPQAVN
jgi:C4-dicarboxylate transporter DctM subunit